jgi:hypothetical protein
MLTPGGRLSRGGVQLVISIIPLRFMRLHTGEGLISRSECESVLDGALAGVLPRIRSEHLDVLRTVMIVNCEVVVDEMERRRALTR